MADFPPGYDPIQADTISAHDQAIGALISLAAFAAIGVGAFLTVEAVADIAAGGSLFPGVEIGGTVYYAEAGTEAIFAAVGDGPLTTEVVALLQQAEVLEGTLPYLDLAAILYLDQYNPVANFPQSWQLFGDYLSIFIPGYTGPGIPPGYPGFPGYGYPNPYGTGIMACVKVNDEYQCHWYR